MIRHVVLLNWKPSATTEQIQAVIDDLNALPAAISQIATYSIGTDAGLGQGNADLVVIGEFDSVDHYKIYATHPAHLAVINDRIKPILTGRAALQYEI